MRVVQVKADFPSCVLIAMSRGCSGGDVCVEIMCRTYFWFREGVKEQAEEGRRKGWLKR